MTGVDGLKDEDGCDEEDRCDWIDLAEPYSMRLIWRCSWPLIGFCCSGNGACGPSNEVGFFFAGIELIIEVVGKLNLNFAKLINLFFHVASEYKLFIIKSGKILSLYLIDIWPFCSVTQFKDFSVSHNIKKSKSSHKRSIKNSEQSEFWTMGFSTDFEK